MHVRPIFLAFLFLSLAACSTDPKPPRYRPPGEHGLGWRLLHPFAKRETTPAPSPTDAAFQPAPKRSLVRRILNPFGGNPSSPRQTGVRLTVEPDNATPSIQATRQLGVRVLVNNYTTKMVSLTFPTSQRIEITARTADGKIIHSYSTDRAFTQEVSILTINPGERLEYSAAVPTRSMTAGNTYLITASVVGQTGMEGTVSITPTP